MKNVPRILPIVGVAVVGVLAVNALAGAKSVPDLLSGAKAFAEGAKAEKKDAKGEEAASAESASSDAAAKAAPPRICAPSATDLAKEAGLSPAELRVLQSLGQRRGQLDQREQDIDVQLQLLAAAEAKLDAKMKTLNGMKGEIQGLLGQADSQKAAEVDRMVTVFSAMKPKDAAVRLTVLEDSVRLPIAAKMKERTLAMILANMAPADAKVLTERLASRFSGDAIAKGKAAVAENAAAPAAGGQQAAAPALAGAGAPKKAG
ncbi:MotE family protein [Caulobacter sp. 602-2]|uniref:MotE family protein n=1 Tax=Caulobacter sp. 602-2 TaxID=2710887 RepID=A0A6G4R323_9CAUL|nr:MotE family protein [Caulobacter sp. 602-2]NGM52109.1 MotE family protein [Caulobacter sp. 602-2]